MKHVRSSLLLFGSVFSLYLSLHLHADNSCECPKLGCDPCSVEKGINFFSEKCGPSDSKVKSCSRPNCLPIAQATPACPAPPSAGSGPLPPIVVTGVPQEEATGANDVAAAGRVKVIQGSVTIIHPDGQKGVITKDSPIREGDRLESTKENGAVVYFKGGNVLHVQPETVVEVKEFKEQQTAASRKVMLNLIRGKIRNQVEQKYNGKTSYYRVVTKGAVAGVRGTDFLISHIENAKMETRVETLDGQVIFQNLDETETREVRKGEGAVYTAPLPTGSDFIVIGKLSEVYPLSGERLVELDRGSRMDIARAMKRAPSSTDNDVAICEKPAAKLNQCSWTCQGNPSGQKACRTEMEQVRCVRQRCNANGAWADETRLPAATSATVCPATGHLVKDCDY